MLSRLRRAGASVSDRRRRAGASVADGLRVIAAVVGALWMVYFVVVELPADLAIAAHEADMGSYYHAARAVLTGGHVGIGNVDVLLAAAIGVAYALGRFSTILAVVGQVKPFAFFPLAVICWRERRIPISTVITIAIGVCLGLAVGGVEGFRTWSTVVAGVLGQGTFNVDNVSISFAGLRLLQSMGWWHYSHGPLHAGPRLYLAAMSFAGPLAVITAFRRLPTAKLSALALLSAALFAPICWTGYLAIAYIPIALWIRDAIGADRPNGGIERNDDGNVAQVQDHH
jgi:hypothetical protein